MLARLNKFFLSLAQPDSNEVNNQLSIEIASTVLLCEVMKADGHLDQREQAIISQHIIAQFHLTEQEVEQLIAKSIALSEHATDFYQFTSQVNQHYSIHDKITMVSQLWRLAMADGKISAIEEHIIRKIADLLHLRHSEYMQAKQVIITK